MESEAGFKKRIFPQSFLGVCVFALKNYLPEKKSWLLIDLSPENIFYHVKSFGSRTMRAKHLTLFAKIMSTGTADFKSNVN